MDNLLANGDMVLDLNGDVQTVQGLQEIIQRALIRLTVRQGNFIYDRSLGSRLHNLDIHSTDDFTLLSIVRDALADMDELSVTGIEKTVNYEEQALFLTVYLRVREQDAVLELNQSLWS